MTAEHENQLIKELRQNIIASIQTMGDIEDLSYIYSEILWLAMSQRD